MKERKRKITTITIIGIMLILAITTFTYAIWSRTHIQTGINKNTYACFEISYAETNGQGISMENGFPQTDEQGMQNEPYEVEITNTCDTVSTYNVILNKQQGSTLKDEHLKVAVDNDYKLLSTATKTDKRTIEGFQNEKSYIIGTGVVGPKQTKIVQIRSWMDEKTSEQDGEDKSFIFKITIEAVAGIGEGEYPLKDLVLASQPISNEIQDFTMKLSDWQLDQDVNIDTSKEICVTSDYDGIYWDETDKLLMRDGICNVTNPQNYIDYYTIDDSGDYYKYKIYKIKEVSGSTITKADIQYYEPVEGSGLYKTQDDDGESYIYRGEINNNYVSFANKLWRIVRINGDETIRIILNDIDKELPASEFNTENNELKYAGYTYDNNSYCTNDNPCISNYNGSGWTNSENIGTSSTIKGKLEEWYNTNLKDYDDKIALTKYCNDTTTGRVYDGYTYYGAGERIERDNTATLQCPNTNVDYGGVYKLKIGLLTADEAMYGAFPHCHHPASSMVNTYYLFHKYEWWTMSPYNFYQYSVNEYIGSIEALSSYNVDGTFFEVLPVINLNPDVTVTGSGTQEDPYVVQ